MLRIFFKLVKITEKTCSTSLLLRNLYNYIDCKSIIDTVLNLIATYYIIEYGLSNQYLWSPFFSAVRVWHERYASNTSMHTENNKFIKENFVKLLLY